jgi:lysophospholipid acyltransferase (LPLAT)-like uncharacterized protein
VRPQIDRTTLIAKAAIPVALYLVATAKASTVRVAIEQQGQLALIQPDEIDSVLRRTLPSPTLLPFWNAHSLLLMCGYLCVPALREHGSSIEAAADDSPGGIITQALYQRIGLIGRQLSLASAERRMSDLKALFLQMPSLAIASDSHGPYRSVSAGMARIVRQYNGHVTPISAVASRHIHVFRRIKMVVPLPSTVILVGIGSPLGSALGRPISAIADELTRALSSLEMNLATLLTPSGV